MTDSGAYCREIESYLCRCNEGHLIRIVGPAFEQVCGWAEAGVPLQVVTAGIDRRLAPQARHEPLDHGDVAEVEPRPHRPHGARPDDLAGPADVDPR
ncbi:MAG: hypothetical protein OXG35_30975, partial [Acidobacteria bacterium]|nr:hypothetical protein [Acidobacteriota bacterium]